MDLSIYAVTTFLTLGVGALLLGYGVRKRGSSGATVFLALTGVLLLAGLAAIGMLAERAPQARPDGRHLDGYLFYSAIVCATTILVHLALTQRRKAGAGSSLPRSALVLLYLPTAIMELVLWFTPWCITGFRAGPVFDIPLPGPLYWIVPGYTIAGPVLAFGLFVRAARRAEAVIARLRYTFLAAGLALSVSVFILAGLSAYHVPFASMAALWPLAMVLFLSMAARALFQTRLPDLGFYVPRSRHRGERLQRYAELRAAEEELARLRTPEEAAQHLATLLDAPVAIRANGGRLLAASKHGEGLGAFPLSALLTCRTLWVREEIRDQDPAVYRAMLRFRVSAIQPLYPYSDGAAGWLLLGEPFDSRFYSERDFREIEPLFGHAAECLLEQLLASSAESEQQERLALDHEAAQRRLQQENEELRRENARLLRERPADSFSLISTASQEAAVPPTLTLLARDKSLLRTLREEFPQLAHYVGPGSEGFRKQPPPDVLIIHIPADDTRLERQLLRMVRGGKYPSAFVLYGRGAQGLIEREHKRLLGHVVALLPQLPKDGALTAWIRAAAELHRATLDASVPDHPLIGRSQVFIDLIAEAMRAARFADPILIRGADSGEILALARFIHSKSGTGPFFVLHANRLGQDARDGAGLSEADERTLTNALRAAREGTLMIDHIDSVDPFILSAVVKRVLDHGEIRLIAGLETADGSAKVPLPPSLQIFTLEIPSLLERRADVPLLAHYYNLLFDLQAASDATLDGTELEALLQSNPVETQAALKALVFEQLSERPQGSARPVYLETEENSKTLDEHVAEFEAELIRRTLEHCNGNKSKAARMLGLRPNTLHYKMVRHGLAGDRKKLDDGE
jgi:transcriptional regulator with AAA-type ATPase domain